MSENNLSPSIQRAIQQTHERLTKKDQGEPLALPVNAAPAKGIVHIADIAPPEEDDEEEFDNAAAARISPVQALNQGIPITEWRKRGVVPCTPQSFTAEVFEQCKRAIVRRTQMQRYFGFKSYEAFNVRLKILGAEKLLWGKNKGVDKPKVAEKVPRKPLKIEITLEEFNRLEESGMTRKAIQEHLGVKSALTFHGILKTLGVPMGKRTAKKAEKYSPKSAEIIPENIQEPNAFVVEVDTSQPVESAIAEILQAFGSPVESVSDVRIDGTPVDDLAAEPTEEEKQNEQFRQKADVESVLSAGKYSWKRPQTAAELLEQDAKEIAVVFLGKSDLNERPSEATIRLDDVSAIEFAAAVHRVLALKTGGTARVTCDITVRF